MRSIVAVALFAASAATSADAAITTYGSSSARLCYEAARSPSKPAGAIERCDEAFANEGLTRDDRVATHVNRGILRANRKDLTGAMADYDAALQLDPNEPEAWLNKGFAYLRASDTARALPMFDAAVARNTREPALAFYGRGLAYEEAGNARAAYADYVRARDLAPKWSLPTRELARFQIKAAR